MSKATLGDILRHVGRNLAKESNGGFGEPLTIPLEAIVRKISRSDLITTSNHHHSSHHITSNHF